MNKYELKKYHIAIAIVAALFVGIVIGNINILHLSTSLPALPLPEITDGQRGELGIDKNINESNIDNYLGRSDSVYHVDGFEIIPYPYLVNVVGLPEAVGKSYDGKTLFTQNDKNEYAANYDESQRILEDIFPKDKKIFLMCGGGGYAGMTKSMLVKLGWDSSKIYVVGGYWFYEGKHDVKVKSGEGENAKYAFWKVPYHNINFDDLTEKKSE